VTTRLDIQDGGRIVGLLLGEASEKLVLGSDEGYGFVTKLGELESNRRVGKAVVTVAEGASVRPRLRTANPAQDRLALATAEGRLLLFPAKELPEMPRGKGNKMMSIPSARVQERVEFVQAIQVLSPEDTLTIHAGRRHLNLKSADLEHYFGERGRRGAKLPRGFQNVDSMAIEKK